MSASKLFEGIPVLWINLDRSHERRKTMEAQFQQHGVKNTRIAAVDGKRLFADPVALSSVQLPRDLKNSQGEVRCSRGPRAKRSTRARSRHGARRAPRRRRRAAGRRARARAVASF